MIYIDKFNRTIVCLLLLFFVQCCTFEWPEGNWRAIINIENKSDIELFIEFKETELDYSSDVQVDPNSTSSRVLNAHRYNENDNLSDNYDFVNVRAEGDITIIELSGDKLNSSVLYMGPDKYKNDIYLLTITQEMVDEALAEAESEESE